MTYHCFLDLDGTLTLQRSIRLLGARFDVLDKVDSILLRNEGEMPVTRHDTLQLAKTFAGISVTDMKEVMAEAPLRPGAHELVQGLRAQGFHMHLVTSLYRPAAEVMRARLRMDDVFAPEPILDGETLTGTLRAPEYPGPCGAFHCKEQVVHSFDEQDLTVAIGDGPNDVCMLQAADHAIGVEPCTSAVRVEADVVVRDLRAVPTMIARRLPVSPMARI